jgi:RNA polymerase sigma-70 factor (ECF subfamily)
MTTAGILRPVALACDEEHATPAIGHLSDEALMQRYQTGDNRAFEILYQRYRGRLHRFVRRVTGASVEADEIFQDVWLAVIKGKSRYAPTARFVTYLFTIAHNRAAEKLRRRGRSTIVELLEDDGSVADGEPDPLNVALNVELGKALADAIALLPVEQREAFLMQAEGGLSLDEIADACGAPRETVKSRLRYASRRLRRTLESWK